jgi:hypothetical protein
MMKIYPLAISAVLALAVTPAVRAQQYEAQTGFGLEGTFSAIGAASTRLEQSPRVGSVGDAGFRLMLYPTLKLSRHWTIAGAYQAVSRPYFYSDFTTQGHGVQGRIVQGYLSYSRVGEHASVIVRAGELSSAFGSFPLRYGDRDNPLIDIPQQYGYYGSPATLAALAGVEADVTWRKLDARAQFVNSSPANPRSVFDKEQYGSWAGGGGITIRQGWRVGVSGYRGPYLDRQSEFYYPAEGRPRSMPAGAIGLDAEWARGHWNLRGELQRFVLTYGPFPSFREHTGYVEAQRALGPRWYVASRFGYLSADYIGHVQTIEAAAGFRPATGQIVKISYETSHNQFGAFPDRTLAVEYVTSIHPLVLAKH